MDFVAIDFEASCLPKHGRSFPIEVGIYDGCVSKSWLILPHGDWASWHWSAEAEALHGIAREELFLMGLSPVRVMEELMRAVDGRRLVADSGIDQYWLETLASAAGYAEVPVVTHVATLLEQWPLSAKQVEDAKVLADQMQPQRHRAAHDAHWLGLVLMELAGQVEPGHVAVAA